MRDFASHVKSLCTRLQALEAVYVSGPDDGTSLASNVHSQLQSLQQRLNSLTATNVSESLSQLSLGEAAAGGGRSKTNRLGTSGRGFIAEKLAVSAEAIVSLNNDFERLENSLQKYGAEQRKLKDSIDTVERKLKTIERMAAMKDPILADLNNKLVAVELTSYNGTFLWTISEVKKKRQEALSGQTLSIYSQPFYTSRTGKEMIVFLHI
jgi:prefoldin subunit 5